MSKTGNGEPPFDDIPPGLEPELELRQREINRRLQEINRNFQIAAAEILRKKLTGEIKEQEDADKQMAKLIKIRKQQERNVVKIEQGELNLGEK